jgi:hypothetical protein
MRNNRLAPILLLLLLTASMATAVQVRIDSLHGRLNDTLFVPIHISGHAGRGIIGVDVTLGFRPEVLRAESAYECGRTANGWFVATNPQPGQLLVAMAGVNELGVGDTLIVLRLFIVAADSSTISFSQCRLNEGTVVCTTRAGKLVLPVGAVEQEQFPDNTARQLVAGPNPARREVDFDLSVAAGSDVGLDIRDVRGAPVRKLLATSAVPCRMHLVWDRRDDHGRKVSPGIYFCRLVVGQAIDWQKLVLLD